MNPATCWCGRLANVCCTEGHRFNSGWRCDEHVVWNGGRASCEWHGLCACGRPFTALCERCGNRLCGQHVVRAEERSLCRWCDVSTLRAVVADLDDSSPLLAGLFIVNAGYATRAPQELGHAWTELAHRYSIPPNDISTNRGAQRADAERNWMADHGPCWYFPEGSNAKFWQHHSDDQGYSPMKRGRGGDLYLSSDGTVAGAGHLRSSGKRWGMKAHGDRDVHWPNFWKSAVDRAAGCVPPLGAVANPARQAAGAGADLRRPYVPYFEFLTQPPLEI